jgi:hypothetical protein
MRLVCREKSFLDPSWIRSEMTHDLQGLAEIVAENLTIVVV